MVVTSVTTPPGERPPTEAMTHVHSDRLQNGTAHERPCRTSGGAGEQTEPQQPTCAVARAVVPPHRRVDLASLLLEVHAGRPRPTERAHHQGGRQRDGNAVTHGMGDRNCDRNCTMPRSTTQ
ncbi:hypothetical protein DWB77_00498 [Streptomyces hundungensis]|uniref:Uncharacterized protein n=1 Tax=Streptomyces hundungensis TaxID=1077946 RepID=A0A387H727_9ACTN|nr:hypothetical protein DWB77_00498 [Streptomyces hundungensis]